MDKLELIPLIHANDISWEMADELEQANIHTHYQNDVFTLNWNDEDSYVETKKWLLKEYGETIVMYDSFAVLAT